MLLNLVLYILGNKHMILLILFNQLQDLSTMLNSPTNTPAQNGLIKSLIEAKKKQIPDNIFGENILNAMINTYMN